MSGAQGWPVFREKAPISAIAAIACLAAAVLPWSFAARAIAQPYPSKPVRLLAGFAPGGTADIVARALAQKMTENMGQAVIVENRSGANGTIATELVARAAPDGYTILLNGPGHATNPALMKLPFDSMRDFAFVSLAAELQNLVVVHPSFPPRSVQELIAFSRRNPGKVNYASSGTGTSVHLAAELFQYMTGVKWIHIPYKGGGPATIELLAGQTSLMFGNLPTVIQHARAGKLRALAVTGAKRSPIEPNIPTVAESGLPGFEVTSWYGVVVPAKTPAALIERLHGEIVRALEAPNLRESLVSQGADPVGNTPEQYTAFVQNEIAKWAKVIPAAGIQGN